MVIFIISAVITLLFGFTGLYFAIIVPTAALEFFTSPQGAQTANDIGTGINMFFAWLPVVLCAIVSVFLDVVLTEFTFIAVGWLSEHHLWMVAPPLGAAFVAFLQLLPYGFLDDLTFGATYHMSGTPGNTWLALIVTGIIGLAGIGGCLMCAWAGFEDFRDGRVMKAARNKEGKQSKPNDGKSTDNAQTERMPQYSSDLFEDSPVVWTKASEGDAATPLISTSSAPYEMSDCFVDSDWERMAFPEESEFHEFSDTYEDYS